MKQVGPIHGHIRKALPRYKRFLEAYEAGTPVVELAEEAGISRQNVNRILGRARIYRSRGWLD